MSLVYACICPHGTEILPESETRPMRSSNCGQPWINWDEK